MYTSKSTLWLGLLRCFLLLPGSVSDRNSFGFSTRIWNSNFPSAVLSVAALAPLLHSRQAMQQLLSVLEFYFLTTPEPPCMQPGCWEPRLLSIIQVRVCSLVCGEADSRIKHFSLFGVAPTDVQGSFVYAERDLSLGFPRESCTACSGNREQRAFLLEWITFARLNLFK